MTAATPPPPRDGEVCRVVRLDLNPPDRRDWCATHGRPYWDHCWSAQQAAREALAAAPSEPVEPPAETQQYRHGGHQPWCGPDCTTMHYPPVPVEAQQDDAHVRGAATIADCPACLAALTAKREARSEDTSDCLRAALQPRLDEADAEWVMGTFIEPLLAARPSADAETLISELATILGQTLLWPREQKQVVDQFRPVLRAAMDAR